MALARRRWELLSYWNDLGRNLLNVHGMPPEPLSVWYFCGEDPLEELERRIGAVMLHYNIAPADIGGRLFVDSGRDMTIHIATPGRAGGAELNQAAIAHIEQTIGDNRIDLVQVDPFISSHAISENDNGAVDMVVKAWGRIADRTGCAVSLIHHVRKAREGETRIEDARGAGSLVDAARVARVLNLMSEQEATEVSVEKAQRFRYFRTDDGKANLAPRAEKATWFHLVSVDLGNAIANRPGDSIGVVTPWTMPGAFDNVTVNHLRQVQKRLADEQWRTSPQSTEWGGQLVGEVLGLDASEPSDKARIRAILQVGEVWRTAFGAPAMQRP